VVVVYYGLRRKDRVDGSLACRFHAAYYPPCGILIGGIQVECGYLYRLVDLRTTYLECGR